MTYGKWVLQERKRKHLSQTELAKRAGVSQATVCWIEAEKGVPYKKSMLKITAALNAAPDRIQMPTYVRRLAVPCGRKTNGDVMREMADEDLVFMINCQMFDCKIPILDRDCYQCKLNWLKKEAKGAKNETETSIPVQARGKGRE